MKILLFILIVILTSKVYCQKIPIIKDFSFGKYWYLDYKDRSGSLDIVDKAFSDSGIVYIDSLFFKRKGCISQNFFQNLLFAKELKELILLNLTIDAVGLFDNDYQRTFQIIHSKIKNGIWFNNSKFFKKIYITDCDIESMLIVGGNTLFKDDVTFHYSRFTKFSDLYNIVSSKIIDFGGIESKDQFRIGICKFYSNVFFNNAKFDYLAINDSYFEKTFHFNKVNVKDKILLARNIFRDTVNFCFSNFENGVDLRRNNFDSVSVFIFEGLEYPDGKLLVNWDQIKADGKPKISVNEFTNDKYDDYRRIELIYEKLRDNYLAQGNKADADNVMYELAVYKSILTPNLSHALYGLFWGYGYKPWRYLVFLVLPILLIFAMIWYTWYYENVVVVLHHNEIKDSEWGGNFFTIFRTKKTKLGKKTISLYDHTLIKKEINNITRFWHVLYFSGSVLLSIRFKKEWIRLATDDNYGQKSFLWVVTCEWLLGITLYILFVLYILSYQFSSFKGIFGF